MQECIASRLTAQIKALRKDMDYKQFALRINKKPSWVYRLEDPNAPPPTVPTLLDVAEAFDIALDVRFCPYSKLLDDVSTLNDRSFTVPSFDEEHTAGVFLPSPLRRRRKARARHRHGHGIPDAIVLPISAGAERAVLSRENPIGGRSPSPSSAVQAQASGIGLSHRKCATSSGDLLTSYETASRKTSSLYLAL